MLVVAVARPAAAATVAATWPTPGSNRGAAESGRWACGRGWRSAPGHLGAPHDSGTGHDLGPYGGRDGSPGGAEIARFLDVARRGGAQGASFWVWQCMTAPEWAALTAYHWPT